MGQTSEWNGVCYNDVHRYQTRRRRAWEKRFCVTAEDDLHRKQATAPSPSTVHDVAHKLHLWQHIKPADRNCRRDFVGKCCRKLTVTRFSWTLCFSDEITFHLMASWTTITAEFMVVSPLRNYRTAEGHSKDLTCGMARRKMPSLDLVAFQESNCDKPFVLRHVRTLHSATVALSYMSPAGRNAPTFWKYCVSF
jgi:hypothetical protein